MMCLSYAICCRCWLLDAQLLRLNVASDMIFLASLKYWMADSSIGLPNITDILLHVMSYLRIVFAGVAQNFIC